MSYAEANLPQYHPPARTTTSSSALPTFSGETSCTQFFDELEDVFLSYDIPPRHKLIVLQRCFVGDALLWFKTIGSHLLEPGQKFTEAAYNVVKAACIHSFERIHQEEDADLEVENDYAYEDKKFYTPEEADAHSEMEVYEEVPQAENIKISTGDVETIIEIDETANQVAVIETSESLNFMDWPFKNLSEICKDDDEVSFYRLFQEEILCKNMIVKENCVQHSQEITTESDESIGQDSVKENPTDSHLVANLPSSPYHLPYVSSVCQQKVATHFYTIKPLPRQWKMTKRTISPVSTSYTSNSIPTTPRQATSSHRRDPRARIFPVSPSYSENAVQKPPWMSPPQPTDKTLLITPPSRPTKMFYHASQPPGQ